KERAVFLAARFKRDNSGVYLLSDRSGEFNGLMFYRFADKRLIRITGHIPWDVSGAAPSDDGRLLAARANVDGREELRLFDARSFKELPAPKIAAGSVSNPEFHRKRPELAFSLNGAHGPSQVHTLDVASGRLEQWTRPFAPEGVDTAAFSEPQIVRWKSFDGRTISGLLHLPPARFAGKRPVMIAIHGGPEAQAKVGFLARSNYYIDELGIALVQPNVRGSSGYGKTFLELDNGM